VEKRREKEKGRNIRSKRTRTKMKEIGNGYGKCGKEKDEVML